MVSFESTVIGIIFVIKKLQVQLSVYVFGGDTGMAASMLVGDGLRWCYEHALVVAISNHASSGT